MIKVAIIIESTSSGVGKHVLDLVDNILLTTDFELHLIHSLVRSDSIYLNRISKLISDKLVVTEISMSRSINLLDFFSFIKVFLYLRKNGPFDVVHCHSSKAGALGSVSAFILQYNKILFSPHGLISTGKTGFKQKLFLFFEKICAFFSTTVVASSLEEFEYSKINFKSSSTSVVYVPNGVHLPEFNLIQSNREKFRKQYSISDSTRLISSIGRLTFQKNPQLFLETALCRSITHKCNEEVFLLVGDGELSYFVKKFLEENKLQGYVLYLGYLEDISLVYSASDIYILHSRYEGMPYTLLENMAYARPVISTHVQSASQLVSQPQDFLVESNPTSISSAIDKLIDSSFRIKIGKENRDKIINQYSIDRMVSSLIQLYTENSQ
jgi:glycosyltransferase involved in cell wall biosynthesis